MLTMTTIVQQRLALTELRSGEDTATWGQQFIWKRIRMAGAFAHTLNIKRQVSVPAGLTTAAVVDTVGQLVRRHDALRTRYVDDEPARLRQRLPADDTLVVEVCEAGDADLATFLPAQSQRLAGTRFDPAVDLGFRAMVVTGHGEPHTVLTVLPHHAVDMHSANLVADDLAALMTARVADRAAPEPMPARQPLAQAAYESSADGARLDEKALRYWRVQLEAVPATVFPVAYPPREVRFWKGELRSTAIALAADALAARYRASTSMILLAGLGVAVGRVTGNSFHPVQLAVGNRFAAQLRHAVGTLAQSGLVVLDLTGPSFADIVRQTWSAVLVAYRNGQCDPTHLDELVDESNRRRSAELELSCLFNDRRTDTRVARDPAPADTIRAACTGTTFRWLEPLPDQHMRYFFSVEGDSDDVVLSMLADTCVLPPEHTRAVLYDIERLLVDEAAAR
jgi:hypothetical protein